MALKCTGFCTVSKKRKEKAPNSIVSCCQEKQSALPLGSSQEVLYLKQPVLVKLGHLLEEDSFLPSALGCCDCCFPEWYFICLLLKCSKLFYLALGYPTSDGLFGLFMTTFAESDIVCYGLCYLKSLLHVFKGHIFKRKKNVSEAHHKTHFQNELKH